MSTERQYKSLLRSIEIYENLLANTSEEVFTQSPPDGGWSYSETYSHIFQSNLISLMAIEKCINHTGINSRKSIHWLARFILLFGKFPPGKFKAPQRIAAMVSKMSREDALKLIVKFRSHLADIRLKLKNADPYQKVKHPRLGLLNAKQWFRFIEVHTIHHTRQLKRISSSLKKA